MVTMPASYRVVLAAHVQDEALFMRVTYTDDAGNDGLICNAKLTSKLVVSSGEGYAAEVTARINDPDHAGTETVVVSGADVELNNSIPPGSEIVSAEVLDADGRTIVRRDYEVSLGVDITPFSITMGVAF